MTLTVVGTCDDNSHVDINNWRYLRFLLIVGSKRKRKIMAISTHTHTFSHTHIHKHTLFLTHTHARTQIHSLSRTHTHTHTITHTHTHTHTHTYSHTHTITHTHKLSNIPKIERKLVVDFCTVHRLWCAVCPVESYGTLCLCMSLLTLATVVSLHQPISVSLVRYEELNERSGDLVSIKSCR